MINLEKDFQKYHNIRPIYVSRELKNVCPIPLKANTYHGCDYGCIYCNQCLISKTRTDRRVKPIPLQYLYDTFIRATNGKGKGEIHEVIRKRWPVQLGVLADPFPKRELLYRNTLRFMKFINEVNYPCMILSKSDIVLRSEYFELLNDDIQIMISIPFENEYAERLEPNVPNPKNRLKVLKQLVDNGIKCTLRLWPLLPGVNDEPGKILEKALDIGVTEIQASYGHIYSNKKYLTGLNNALGFEILKTDVDMIHEKKYYMPTDAYRIDKLTIFKEYIEPDAKFFTPNSPVMNEWVSCCGQQLNNYNSDALKCKGYELGDGVNSEDYLPNDYPFEKVFKKEYESGKYCKIFNDITFDEQNKIYIRS